MQRYCGSSILSQRLSLKMGSFCLKRSPMFRGKIKILYGSGRTSEKDRSRILGIRALLKCGSGGRTFRKQLPYSKGSLATFP